MIAKEWSAEDYFTKAKVHTKTRAKKTACLLSVLYKGWNRNGSLSYVSIWKPIFLYKSRRFPSKSSNRIYKIYRFYARKNKKFSRQISNKGFLNKKIEVTISF